MYRQRQTKTFRIYLVSYLLVALLPLACIVVFSLYSENTTATQYIIQKAKKTTENVMNSVDSHLAIISGYSQMLNGNPAVRAFHFDPSQINQYTLIEELHRYLGGNKIVSNIVLYFRDSKQFVSAYANSYDIEDLLDRKILIYRSRSPHELAALLETIDREMILPKDLVLQQQLGTEKSTITHLQSLPQNNRYAFATVLTLIDEEAFSSLIGSDNVNGYFLLDAVGQMVMSHAGGICDFEDLPFDFSSKQSGCEKMTINRQDVIISWCVSSRNWTLIQLVSVDEIQENYHALVFRTGFVLLLLGFLVTFLITIFMQKTYSPIGHLANIAQNGATAACNGTTDINIIENALQSLKSENALLTMRVKTLNPLVAEFTARMLLSTPEDAWDQAVYESGQKAGLRLECGYYQALVLSYEHQQLQTQVMREIVELFYDTHVVSFAEAGNKRIVLLLGADNEELFCFDEDNLAISAANAVGIGPTVTSVKKWNETYIMAAQACDQAEKAVDDKILHFADLEKERADTDQYPWPLMQAFAAALNQKNTSTALNISEQITKFITNDINRSKQVSEQVSIQALILLRENLTQHAEEIDEYIDAMNNVESRPTSLKIAEVITDLVAIYCERENQNWQHKDDSPIYSSLVRINEMIGSQQLSLSYIASSVNLSPSRYSFLFHEEMQCNFKEYVDSLRIDRAKLLLCQTNSLISEIGEQVGYLNAYSFTRFFKSKTGLTPNEYRSRYQ